MSKLLLLLNGNWADEIDYGGFEIVEQEYYDDALRNVSHEKAYGPTISIGSNQFAEFESAKDVMDSISVIPITDEEAETIVKLFGKYPSWSKFPSDWLYELANEFKWS